MSCSCITVDCSDPLEPIVDVLVFAIFHHRCCECESGIKPGDKYELFQGVNGEEEFKVYKTCPSCLSVRNEFFCGGWIFRRMWEEVAYHIDDMNGEVSSECLLSLQPRARSHMFDIIEEVWEEMDFDDDT